MRIEVPRDFYSWLVDIILISICIDKAPATEDLAIATSSYLTIAKKDADNGDYSTAITQYENVYAMYNTAVGTLHDQTQIAMDRLVEASWNMHAHNRVLRALGLFVVDEDVSYCFYSCMWSNINSSILLL